MKKLLSIALVVVLLAGMAVTGTMAYLQDSDSDVNVMTLGNVKIAQHEYERALNDDGTFKTDTIDNRTSYVLKDFTQGKALLPIVGDPSLPGDDPEYAGYDDTTVRMSQVDSYGGMQVFAGKNAQDKFVTVENTGRSDAYVRTLIAFEIGSLTEAEFGNVIGKSSFMTDQGVWKITNIGTVEIDGNNYFVCEYIYNGGAHLGGVHENGVLPAGDTTYPSLAQVYMKSTATNEDVEKIDGNKNGTYDILVLSQAVQTNGFDNAQTALDTAFGKTSEKAAEWFGGVLAEDAAPTAPANNKVVYNGTEYNNIYEAVAAANENRGGEIKLMGSATLDRPVEIAANITINGNVDGKSAAFTRADGYTGTMFTVKAGATLTLENVIADGGAVWEGETDPTLGRGTTNSGITATGNIIEATGNGSIVLNEGAVIQNNDGVNAVSLATRGGGSLTVNGAQIINNTSAAGAIWGGGNITINEGSKINGNHATSIGGAIRMVNGYNTITFTMNGGEMNHNKSNSTGGAIWGGNNATYILAGGEMAYNSASTAGGAIWTGTYEKYTISGDFYMHDNSAGELGGAIRFSDHASLTMTGGKVANNTVGGNNSAFYLNNNSATISGGTVEDNFSYSGGLGLTIGAADIDGVIAYNLGTNHNTAYLAKDFNGFKFTVNESAANFAQFNFKPAADYTYTAGDEAKLECMNEGYSTYWDAVTGTFKLKAN